MRIELSKCREKGVAGSTTIATAYASHIDEDDTSIEEVIGCAVLQEDGSIMIMRSFREYNFFDRDSSLTVDQQAVQLLEAVLNPPAADDFEYDFS